MREIGSREFQISYQKLKEPVKVVTRSGAAKTIGFFYPGEMPPMLGTQEPLFGDDEAPKPPDELESII